MKHYRLNTVDARNRTRRDPEQEREAAEDMGFYTYNVLKILPLDAIVPERVWKPSRYENVTAAIERGASLPAIQVVEKGGKYTIDDGIHRYNASRDAGMTHIPAIYTVVVETPELYKPPEPEKDALQVGAWVRLRDPKRHRAEPWACVDEVLGIRVIKGVRRHLYALVGVVGGDAEFLGDFVDTEFDPAPRPPVGVQETVGRWLTASRVASRYLGVPTPRR